MRRFFVLQSQVEENAHQIHIDGDEFNHLKNVLRLKVGDEIICFTGDGFDYVCKIEKIENTKAVLSLVEKQQNWATPKQRITLFQGALKSDKFEFLVQKSAELGASEIVPFESAFSVAKVKSDKIDRWAKIALSASKQCQRSDILKVGQALSFKNLLKTLEKFDLVLFANEREQASSIKDLNLQNYIGKEIALVVGSEGGFSEIEAQKIVSVGGKSVSLGKRILRAETAPLALLSICNFLLGEM